MSDSKVFEQSQRPDGLWEGYAMLGGMTCAACAIEVEQEIVHLNGLRQLEVNAASGLTHWVAETAEGVNHLSRRVNRLGYNLVQADQLTEINAKLAKATHRSEALRLLIAVLCMMQIMMYSTPEYLFQTADIGQSEVLLLRWAQWVICLPVLLYSAKPIFSNAWRAIAQGRWSVDQPVALGLLIAFSYSSINLHQPQAHVWFDSLAMLVTLLLLSRLLVNLQSRRAMAQLLSIGPDLPSTVIVSRLGARIDQAVGNLSEGDEFWLMTGQVCPIDSKAPVNSKGIWVDESMRTGESLPIFKPACAAVLSGAKLLSSDAKLIVDHAGQGVFFKTLQSQIQQAVSFKPQQQLAIEKVIPWFVFVVLSIAVVSGSVWLQQTDSFEMSIQVVVAVLLVSCPCALALSWPLVRLFAMRNLAEAGVMVRQPDCFDTLPKVNHICLDKTGTLTNAAQAKVEVNWLGDCLLPGASIWRETLFLQVAGASSHPLAKTIQRHFMHLHGQPTTVGLLEANEFVGQGVEALVKVEGQQLLVRMGKASFCQIKAIDEEKDTSLVYLSAKVKDGVFGFSSLAACKVVLPVNEAVSDWLSELHGEGYRLSLLSGDTQAVVGEWAKALPFDDIKGEMSIADKRDWIAGLQRRDDAKVLMCGDGLNDAAALTQADVSVCVSGGSGLSAKQADVLINGSTTQGLSRLIKVSALAHRVGWQNVMGSLLYNLGAIALAVTGLLQPWMAALGMGLSSLGVLLNSLRVSFAKGR